MSRAKSPNEQNKQGECPHQKDNGKHPEEVYGEQLQHKPLDREKGARV